MRSSFGTAVAAAAIFGSVSATFNAAAKTNVVTYWGQGADQDRLLVTCQNPSYDIINVGFVDVFPDQGAGGWPGTNFGNACWGDVYENKGVNTSLLKTCPDIGPDVIECQQTYGKKIFLSLGGGYPTDYYIKDATSAKNFANFLWAAFGPSSATKSNVPRPWGTAGVDGFDFDIENIMSPAPQSNYQSSGYAAMINQFKNVLFPQDTTKSYYISGAPQCTLPDTHLSAALASSWFDFIWIQFYNTAGCSARDGVNSLAGSGTSDISYTKWTTQKSKNPNVKMYLGLPASNSSAIDASYYLQPAEAQKLVNEFYSNSKFGGIMVWEATAAQNNTPCNVDYGTWMKDILTSKSKGKTYPTNIKTCKGVSKRSEIEEVAAAEKREASYNVDTCTETATQTYGSTTSYSTYETTRTWWATVPSGYYVPSSSPVVAISSSAPAFSISTPASSAAADHSSAPAFSSAPYSSAPAFSVSAPASSAAGYYSVPAFSSASYSAPGFSSLLYSSAGAYSSPAVYSASTAAPSIPAYTVPSWTRPTITITATEYVTDCSAMPTSTPSAYESASSAGGYEVSSAAAYEASSAAAYKASSAATYHASSAAAYEASSAAAYETSSAAAYTTLTTDIPVTVVPVQSGSAPAAYSAPSGYGSSPSQAWTLTTAIPVTVVPVQSGTAPVPYPVPSGNGTGAWGTASASAGGAYPSASGHGWGVPATGGAESSSSNLALVILGGVAGVLFTYL